MSLIVVYVTHENESAARVLADAVVQQRLAACANLFPIQSAYWWQGELQHEAEWVSLLKSTPEQWAPLRQLVEQLHPYDVPCVIKYEVQANEAYERWVREQVS